MQRPYTELRHVKKLWIRDSRLLRPKHFLPKVLDFVVFSVWRSWVCYTCWLKKSGCLFFLPEELGQNLGGLVFLREEIGLLVLSVRKKNKKLRLVVLSVRRTWVGCFMCLKNLGCFCSFCLKFSLKWSEGILRIWNWLTTCGGQCSCDPMDAKINYNNYQVHPYDSDVRGRRLVYISWTLNRWSVTSCFHRQKTYATKKNDVSGMQFQLCSAKFSRFFFYYFVLFCFTFIYFLLLLLLLFFVLFCFCVCVFFVFCFFCKPAVWFFPAKKTKQKHGEKIQHHNNNDNKKTTPKNWTSGLITMDSKKIDVNLNRTILPPPPNHHHQSERS